ncbi:YgjP-like metallopeptidase domain-containing protein [Alteromonas gilva]|uniref:M48 family metallopeptidase n=1 Tax=Alteromonas gilva TaxID=2987522 RepID=A0ABT5KZT9_9ALTE|nr:M48 family metallopeptidase [Alteromonas gilva]MDC8829704.1 M48 family metallopeptidase [Alteromonas gilva]
MPKPLTYLTHYPQHLQDKIQQMKTAKQLGNWLRSRYPNMHSINNDKELREYAQGIKNQFMKKTQPLSKVVFDNKIHIVNHALGLHSYVSRVQGGKLKSKNEMRISALFKNTPEPFLNMIVVHELAHLKEKEHNKAFYQLCRHMLPDYHQIEFDVRVYLTEMDATGYVFNPPTAQEPF